jgi:hypothetical protein
MQNGRAERANRTIMESARAMLHHAGMSYGFWEHAVSTAVYVRNRSPHRSNKYISPYERLMGYPPDLSHLRVFGCLAYRHIHKDHRRKLDPKAERLTFVGYDTETKGYRLWNSAKRSVVISSDVEFEENVFPHRKQPIPAPSEPAPPPVPVPSPDPGDEPEVVDIDLNVDDDDNPGPPPAQHEPVLQPPALPPRPPCHPLRPPSPPPANPQPGLRRSSRIPRLVLGNPQQQRVLLRRGGAQEVSVWDNSMQAYLAAAYAPQFDINGDPLLYRDALCTPEVEKWKTAMDEEMDSLMNDHQVWRLVDLPKGRTPIKCRWRYVTKRDTDNRPVRFKARLVAKGFAQIYGVDYDETFAPVARLDTVRLLLAIAAAFDLEIHQIDIKTAFLHGELEEEIFMEQPEGYVEPGNEHKVCLLLRSLYGLKQSARQWYKHLRASMKTWNFSESIAGDIAVFTKIDDAGNIVVVVVYVDDLSILASTLALIAEFKARIASIYRFTDVGEITHFLGLRVLRNRKTRTISIDQQHYIEKIVERFDFETAPPKWTPMTSSSKLVASHHPTADSALQKRYQSMVGSLMYAMLGSRPDICFAVNKLAQYGSNPDEEHLAAAQRVFQYLKATRDYRLTYNGNTGSELVGWCDADWASDPDTRRSTTGYVFQVGSGSIAWATRKQRTVALSSTESEYMALAESLQHTIWTTQILKNLNFGFDLPIPLKSDSKGARDLAKNNVFHKLSKHIEIRYHFIREKVEDGFVILNEVKSAANVADIFTKALPEPAHQRHVRALGLIGTSDEGEC